MEDMVVGEARPAGHPYQTPSHIGVSGMEHMNAPDVAESGNGPPPPSHIPHMYQESPGILSSPIRGSPPPAENPVTGAA